MSSNACFTIPFILSFIECFNAREGIAPLLIFFTVKDLSSTASKETSHPHHLFLSCSLKFTPPRGQLGGIP